MISASARDTLAVPADITRGSRLGPYHLLFFVSGIPALLYQIVWQRALFTIYGVNIESVTVIVTAFMLGLGLGSLAGGWLSKRSNIPLLAIFGGIELGIAGFGLFSLKVFHAAALFTAGVSGWETGGITFALLLVPTLLMGSTLPLLVAHLVRQNGNVGESVGSLYAVNTFGSAVACFLAAYVLMRALGESGSVQAGAAANACVAAAAFSLHLRSKGKPLPLNPETGSERARRPNVLRFRTGLLLAFVAGLIALGYELIWYRLYSFASRRSAAGFSLLLGWYLAGVAYGSLVVRDACRRKLRDDLPTLLRSAGSVVIWANIAAFLVGPALAVAVTRVPFDLTYPLVFAGAALLGAAFPMIAHASINPAGRTGASLSYLYLSNIIGCASGSYVVGFAAMDNLATNEICAIMLSIGLSMGFGLYLVSGRSALTPRRLGALAVALALIAGSSRLYSQLYERLLFQEDYRRFTRDYGTGARFRHLVETRSGVVAVTPDGTVIGGGVYDGRVSTDLVHDGSGIFRAFAVDALHPEPKEVLIIGLSLGSWAQVLANNPRVAKVTIVEINPGYLRIIPAYPAVSSLLRNPKVEIVVDDGRRWLVRNRARTFDVIVMNTTQHWLAHTSNLLSVEFLQLVRPHLKPGGIHYYNTTFSSDALLTGATVFPYALRVWNCLAVSDRPIVFRKERWRAALADYSIDGAPIFDFGNATHRDRFNEILSLADTLHDPDVTKAMRIESGESIRARLKTARIITDDNMGTEWR